MAYPGNDVCFLEDFTLKLGDSVKSISFHHSLNVFLVTTNDHQIRVFDSHSAAKLTEVSFSEEENGGCPVIVSYHPGSSSILVLGSNGSVGQRRPYHGVLLLHSVLQLPVASAEDFVTLDLLHAEAVLLQKALDNLSPSMLNFKPSLGESVGVVKEVVQAAIAAHVKASSVTASNMNSGSSAVQACNTNTAIHRSKKWQCVTVRLPVHTFRTVLAHTTAELRAGTQALGLAAALTHRLTSLHCPPATTTTISNMTALVVSSASQVLQQPIQGSGETMSSLNSHQVDLLERDPMYSEAARLATFDRWPHMDYEWALPAQMAEAGFYHQPLMADDDRAMCFICSVCLVLWEPTDEPWSEHERHSPSCPFVRGEYTHNVPLSYTLSTSPAVLHHNRSRQASRHLLPCPTVVDSEVKATGCGNAIAASRKTTPCGGKSSDGGSVRSTSSNSGTDTSESVDTAASNSWISYCGSEFTADGSEVSVVRGSAGGSGSKTSSCADGVAVVALENEELTIKKEIQDYNGTEVCHQPFLSAGSSSINTASEGDDISLHCTNNSNSRKNIKDHRIANNDSELYIINSEASLAEKEITCDNVSESSAAVNCDGISSMGPARPAADMLLGCGNCADYTATGCQRDSSVVVWKMSGTLQKALSFYIDPTDALILVKHFAENLSYLISRFPRGSTAAPHTTQSHNFSPQPPKQAWMDHSFDSPHSPHSLHSPPDHWDDNEAITPTNLSPSPSPMYSPPHLLSHSVTPTPILTPTLTVCHSPSDLPTVAQTDNEPETSSLDAAVHPKSIEQSTTVGESYRSDPIKSDKFPVIDASMSLPSKHVEENCASISTPVTDTHNKKLQHNISVCSTSCTPTTAMGSVFTSPPSLLTLACTPTSASNVSQCLSQEVGMSHHDSPADHQQAAACLPSHCISSDMVQLWELGVLSDPAEVSYYRRGGDVNDLPNAAGSKGGRGTAKETGKAGIARPALVAAVGLRYDETMPDAAAFDRRLELPRTSFDAEMDGMLEELEQLEQLESLNNRLASEVYDMKDIDISKKCSSNTRYMPYLLVYDLNLETHVSRSYNRNDCKSSDANRKKTNRSAPCLTEKSSSGTRKQVSVDPNFVSYTSRMNSKLRSVGLEGGVGSLFNSASSKSKAKEPSNSYSNNINNDKSAVLSCVQCIPLPQKLNNVKYGLKVTLLVPSSCGKFLIVCLAQDDSKLTAKSDGKLINDRSSSTVPDSSLNGFSSEEQTSSIGSCYESLLVYGVESGSGDSVVTFTKSPVLFHYFTESETLPTNIITLPSNAYENECNTDCCYCMCACVCRDGAMRVFSVETLEYTYHLPPPTPAPGQRPEDTYYHTLTYCHILGMERICVCQRDGSSQLVNLVRPGDYDSSDEADGVQQVTRVLRASGCNTAADERDAKESGRMKLPHVDSEPLFAEQPVTEHTLLQCLKLTQFQPGCPNMVATVPPCWLEVTQAQQQRRNVHHQQHQHLLPAASETTRCWRLDYDNSSYDDHLLELMITPSSGSSSSPNSSAITVGHINLRLQLAPNRPNLDPSIQVSLLRQVQNASRGSSRTCGKSGTSSSKSHKAASTSALDAAMAAVFEDFAMIDQLLDSPPNPCTTSAFQSLHNAELVCGPVSLGDCLDLSGHVASVNFVSPALVTHRGRCTFLLHIKAASKGVITQNKISVPDIVSSYCPPEVAIRKGDTFLIDGASANAVADAMLGCNVIQQLSITLNTAPSTQADKRQRSGILNKVTFHNELVKSAVCDQSSMQLRYSALDLLLWLLVVHSPQTQGGGRDSLWSTEYRGVVCAVQRSLPQLVRRCLLLADRTIARKTAKMIVMIIQQEQERPSFDSEAQTDSSFASSACEAVLECVPLVPACRSAGALAHFFMLLNYIKWEDEDTAAARITELLSQTDTALAGKEEQYHALLQARFGLHGSPLHRTLFNVLPPCIMDFKAKQIMDRNVIQDNLMNSSSITSGNGLSGSKNVKPGLLTSIGVTEIDTILFGPINTNGNSSSATSTASNSSSSNSQPKHGNAASNSSNFNRCVSVNNGGSSSSSNSPCGEGWSSLCPALPGLCGLLEVEPLHVTLHAASDGTKLQQTPGPLAGWGSSTGNVGADSSQEPNGSWFLENEDEYNIPSGYSLQDMLGTYDPGQDYQFSSIHNLMDMTIDIEQAKAKFPDTKKAINNVELSKLFTSTAEELNDPAFEDLDAFIAKKNEQINKLEDQSSMLQVLLEKTLLLEQGVSSAAFTVSKEKEAMLAAAKSKVAQLEQIFKLIKKNETELLKESKSVIPDVVILNSDTSVSCSKEAMVNNVNNSSELPSGCSLTEALGKDANTNNELSSSSSSMEAVTKNEISSSELLTSNSVSFKADALPTVKSDDSKKEDCNSSRTESQGGVIDNNIATLTASSWQQFLSLPTQQHLIVEKMYSGSRRFVVLDFGEPVMLTDVVVPVCSDLVSLSLDVWLTGEERDAQCLVVCPDINSRPLILTDLQPPPLCRFVKLTCLGRFGMITAESTISLGNFYGHRLLLPWAPRSPEQGVSYARPKNAARKHVQSQLSIAASVAEAVDCRYTLASDKLRSLLQLYSSRYIMTADTAAPTLANAGQDEQQLSDKIRVAHQECLFEQHHLNVITLMLRRLRCVLGLIQDEEEHPYSPVALLQRASCDQLQTIHQYAINSLLSLTLHPTHATVSQHSMSPVLLSYCGSVRACLLFQSVLQRGSVSAQVCFAATLLRTCAGEPWWGKFLTGAIQDLFKGGCITEHGLPTVRVFGLLTFLGQKSVCSGQGSIVINAALEALAEQLQPCGNNASTSGVFGTDSEASCRYDALFSRLLPPSSSAPANLELLEWVLLYLSHCLDALSYVRTSDSSDRSKETAGKWSWLCAESWLSADTWYTRRNKACKERIRKRLGHHSASTKHMADSLHHHRIQKMVVKSETSTLCSKLGSVLQGRIQQIMNNKKMRYNKLKQINSVESQDGPRSFAHSVARLAAARAGASGEEEGSSGSSGVGGVGEGRRGIISIPALLQRDTALTVVRGLLALLSSYTSANYDTFLVMCKVVGVVCSSTRPCLRLCEVLRGCELQRLVQHTLSLHQHRSSAPHTAVPSPWAMHAIVCFLTDILNGEKRNGEIVPEEGKSSDSLPEDTSDMFSVSSKKYPEKRSKRTHAHSDYKEASSARGNTTLSKSFNTPDRRAAAGLSSCIVEDIAIYDDFGEDHNGLDSKDTDCLLGNNKFIDTTVEAPSSSSSYGCDSKDTIVATKGNDYIEVACHNLEFIDQKKLSVKLGDNSIAGVGSEEEGPLNGSVSEMAAVIVSAASSEDEQEDEEGITEPSDDLANIAYSHLEEENSESNKENTPPCALETAEGLAAAAAVLSEAKVVASTSIHQEESSPLAKASASEVTVSKATTAGKESGSQASASEVALSAAQEASIFPPIQGWAEFLAANKAAKAASAHMKMAGKVRKGSLYQSFMTDDLPGLTDSEESSENEELIEGLFDDLDFMNMSQDDAPYFIESNGANLLNNSWEVVNVSNIKSNHSNNFSSSSFSTKPGKEHVATKPSVYCGSGSSLNSSGTCLKCGIFHSTAVDQRLHSSVLLQPELRLAMLHATHTATLHAAVTAPLQVSPSTTSVDAAPITCRPSDPVVSTAMLRHLFDVLMGNLASQCISLDLDGVVSLWLSLVLELCGDHTEMLKGTLVPQLPLSSTALAALLQAILNCGTDIRLKTWGSILHLLTLSCNSINMKADTPLPLVEDDNFKKVLVVFLTTNFDDSSGLVGSSFVTLFHNLLVRLTFSCNCFAANSRPGNKLKMLLLDVVSCLLHNGVGSCSSFVGSLDAQCVLMRHLTKLHYAGLQDTSLMLDIVSRTAAVVHKHLLHTSQATKLSISSSGSSSIGSSRSDTVTVTTGNTANGLLGSFGEGNSSGSGGGPGNLGGGSGSAPWGGLAVGLQHSSLPRPDTDTFLYTLLTLVEQLLETPVLTRAADTCTEGSLPPTDAEARSTEGKNSSSRSGLSTVTCNHTIGRDCRGGGINILADTVVCNRQTTSLLFRSLGLCSDSVDVLQRSNSGTNNSDGSSVSLSVAVYNILSTLNRTLARPHLLLQPMLDYITTKPGGVWLPFSPLCLRVFTAVIDCEEMLGHLTNMGGIQLLWQNLTESVSRSCCQHGDRMGGFIASIMNELSPALPAVTRLPGKLKRSERLLYNIPNQASSMTSNMLGLASSNPFHNSKMAVHTGGLVGTAGAGPGDCVGAGVMQGHNLVNFAPLAMVSSSHQGGRSPHSLVMPTQFLQRSKTPCWSHPFCSGDTFIVLNLKLPCPVLLHEIVLQPHSAPSTYPSAVSVTAGLEGRCSAITGLLPTDTLSYVKIVLRSPIIASVINIRLYKPKDSSMLVLSQIRLMGTTAFKGLSSLNDGASCLTKEDTQRSQSDFSPCDWWLLLLRHCMHVVPAGRDSVLQSGVLARGSVSACVNFLLSPHFLTSTSNMSICVCDDRYKKMPRQACGTVTAGSTSSKSARLDNSTCSDGYTNSKSCLINDAVCRKARNFPLSSEGGISDTSSLVSNSQLESRTLASEVQSSNTSKTCVENPKKGDARTSVMSEQATNSSSKIIPTSSVSTSTNSSTAASSQQSSPSASSHATSFSASSSKSTASSPRLAAELHSGNTPLEQIILGLARQSPQWLEEFVAEMLCYPRLAQQCIRERGCGLRLLYTVCVDEAGSSAVAVLLHWLQRLLHTFLPASDSSPQPLSKMFASASLLHTAAAIIWNTKKHLQQDTEELFRSVVVAACSCNPDSSVKRALDALLCALCHVQPRHFAVLAATITGFGQTHSEDADRLSVSTLVSGQLQSVVAAAQSGSVINTLLSSNLLVQVVYTVLEWCQLLVRTELELCKKKKKQQKKSDSEESSVGSTVTEPAVTATSVTTSPVTESPPASACDSVMAISVEVQAIATLVRMLAELCTQPAVQDWMGHGPGALLWNTLLTVLGDPTVNNSSIDLGPLEAATIDLLRKACLNHPDNHRHISSHLCNLIRRQKNVPAGGLCFVHSLSGFSRSLVVQVLLQCERMIVEVEVCCGATLAAEPPVEWLHTASPPHPRHGLSLNNRLLSLPLDITVADIIAELTGTADLGSSVGNSEVTPPQWQSNLPSTCRKDKTMVIYYEDDDDEDDYDDGEDDDDEVNNQISAVDQHIIDTMVAYVSGGIKGGSVKASKSNKEKNSDGGQNSATVVGTSDDDGAGDSTPKNPDSTSNNNNVGSNTSDCSVGGSNIFYTCTVVATRTEITSTSGQTEGLRNECGDTVTKEETHELEVPLTATIAQILAGLKQCVGIQNTHIKLRIGTIERNSNSSSDSSMTATLPLVPGVKLLLEEFSLQGGLTLLAQHMTVLYPDNSAQCVSQQHATLLGKSSSCPNTPLSNSINNAAQISGNTSALWASMAGNMVNNNIKPCNNNNAVVTGGALCSVAPHTLGAFTLFLRLPGYTEALLQRPGEAKVLLRMALGVHDAGVKGSLRAEDVATVVYTRLNEVLLQYPSTSTEGLALRSRCLDCGVLHHLLGCLAALSAHSASSLTSTLRHKHVPISSVIAGVRGWCMDHYGSPTTGGGVGGRSESGSSTVGGGGTGVSGAPPGSVEDRCHYWAKGTGFGTGSTVQSWDVEQAIVRQRVQEEHIVWLLRLLHNFINPSSDFSEAPDSEPVSSVGETSVNAALNSSTETYTHTSSKRSTDGLRSNGDKATLDSDTANHLGSSANSTDMDNSPCPDSLERIMTELLQLIRNAHYMDKIASHLSNDSVLDLSRHVPLYRAVLALVRSIAVTEPLSALLLHQPSFLSEQSGASLLHLLSRMTCTVNTYISKLSWKPSKPNGGKSDGKEKGGSESGSTTAAANGKAAGLKHLVKTLIYTDDVYDMTNKSSKSRGIGNENCLTCDDTDDEGLTLLVPDLQRTEQLVKKAFERLIGDSPQDDDNKEDKSSTVVDKQRSLTQIYLDTLKPLQFDSHEMVVEDNNSGQLRFTVTHLFEGALRNITTCSAPRRIKRLAQEAVTLSSSLPLSYSSSVFIRTDTDRLDIMKVLIVGPDDTPYANGLFEFDVYFPVDYPTSPLQIKLQTTGEGKVRFNPNLYQDGKVCLSILNTWHGRPEEKWNSQTSSLLQVLVSIQSLILVNEPYFNEPGYERSRGTASATQHSREYDANIRTATVKWAILNQLREPSPCFKEVVERHFYLKQHDILEQVDDWIVEMEGFPESSRRTSRGLPHGIVALKKLLLQLQEEFSKLKPPAGLEDVHVTLHPAPSPSDAAATVAPGASCSHKPRERKTSKANLMADLKWSVIDEEVEDDSALSSLTPLATESSPSQLLAAGSASVPSSPPTSDNSLDSVSVTNAMLLGAGTGIDESPTLPTLVNAEPEQYL